MNRTQTLLIVAAAVSLFAACGDQPELLNADGSFAGAPADFPTTEYTDASGNTQQSAADRFAWVMVRWTGASEEAAVNLDLHVIDPNGNELTLTDTTEGTARYLEHPECVSYDCRGDEQNPSETIFWSRAELVPGEYKAWVENISEQSGSFDIQIMFGDYREDSSGSAAPGQRSSEWTWTVEEQAAPTGECLSQLTQLGVQYEPITIREGSCSVEDAVMVSGPLGGVTYKVDYARSTTRFRTSCETALALHRYGRVMTSKGITTAFHNGSFNCRNIAGTNSRSTHAVARAMDINGFGGNGQEYSVLRDWNKGEKGRVLRALSTEASGIFQSVLTPDTDADHADHFHLDIGR